MNLESNREIIEELASLAHEQWSEWIKYLFSKSIENSNGMVTIPKWAVERWKRQMNMTYSELSEQEKANDRIEAIKVFRLMENYQK